MSFAKKMIAALEEALLSNVAVKQVVVDGITSTFNDRDAMLMEYHHWKNVAAKECGKRRTFRTIDLS